MESISVNDLAGIICTVAIRSRVSHRSNEAGRARAINWLKLSSKEKKFRAEDALNAMEVLWSL
uniref:Uncharacterized protein n=1 Tax=Oryza punctata TaxID=4537 RepID=A0A0E0L701_ORYPU